MVLPLEEVRRIARLARIEISDREALVLQGDLQRIFELIDAMQQVDTEGVEPMAHAQDLGLRLREDAVTEADRRALYQPLAPQVQDGLYLVPRVIE
jgi:aspartyl-tRNA(Asn)/glutamyl-tRNA(Gln) amidotransferase subunit C